MRAFKNALKGDKTIPEGVNDVVMCTLLFRGFSREDIENSTEEEIHLYMAFDNHLQKEEQERMNKMFGG